MPFQPFNPDGLLHIHRQKLPHWRQWGTTYFVTSRLADSIPNPVANLWRSERDKWLDAQGLSSVAELDSSPDETLRHAYHRRFTARFHELLDAGHGECLLQRPECAMLVEARLIAAHAKAYHLDAWVIMPNHFHAVVEPAENVTLGEIVRHWKGGGGFDINRLLGRKGSLWQREPFDHIVRSEAQLRHFRRYVSENPAKARLHGGFVLGFGAQSGVSADFVANGGEERGEDEAK